MQAYRHVGGQGPGRGGPDGDRYFARVVTLAGAANGLPIDGRVSHIDGRRQFVLVLHLRLGQRRPAIRAPVHRLESLVQVAVGDDARQGPDNIGFELEIHGQVGVVPVAHNAHADEFGALAVHLATRIRAAFVAERRGTDLDPGFAHLFFHVQLNGQAVTVPARNIGRVESRQAA